VTRYLPAKAEEKAAADPKAGLVGAAGTLGSNVAA
jgi:hypothetical protein